MELQRYHIHNDMMPNGYKLLNLRYIISNDGAWFKADEAESLIAEKDQRIKELEAVNLAKDRLILAKKAENQRLREALEKYADEERYIRANDEFETTIYFNNIGPEIAKQALNEESKP